MKTISWLAPTILLCTVHGTAAASAKSRGMLEKINATLCGRVIDYTNNHGCDRRIWSPALCARRDVYVYVPPGFDPGQSYPVLVYLHGFTQDEQWFLENQVGLFDKAIVRGELPPVIIVTPDGSIKGKPSFSDSASFFVNSKAGNFEDYLMVDVWNFVVHHYPIRPEPEAHVLCGISMGGSAAFHLAIKHRDRFRIAVGFAPALNLRWVDCHGRYKSDFDPCCWGWRTQLNPEEVIGIFYGFVKVRFKKLSDPLFGRGPDVICELSRINPIEAIDRYHLQPGELAMYVAYGGRDEFNIKAQAESFLYRARERGLEVTVGYDPQGKHDLKSGVRLFPACMAWLGPRLAPYSPPLVLEAAHP